MAEKKTEKIKEKLEKTFSKENLINSKRFENQKDLLNALLKDDLYTIEEVEKLVKDYLGGVING